MNRTNTAPTPAFGLTAWLEETKVSLPLKGVECRFEVTAGVASVELDQIYHQQHREPLDCTYTFPLPAGAAVYRCEMHVNGRLIRAKIEAEDDARQIFQEQKAAGRRAALVERERENVFTLSLGNLQPDDTVVLRLAYFQTTERTGAEQRLRIPVCPGVRYIPGKPLLRSLSGRGTADDTDQVPDASRISPPRIDALHPDAAYFSAEGRLSRSDFAPGSVSSPSHPLLVQESEAGGRLALHEGGAVPDRDLVVCWQEPDDQQLAPRAWDFAGGEEHFALVQLRGPAGTAKVERPPEDFYFLVDRSGSMGGLKWTKSCEALIAFVRLLAPADRVWITAFESAFQDFAEAPLPAAQLLHDATFLALAEIEVEGGTELLPAAEHVLEKIAQHSATCRASVILITDGQVGNDGEILSHFAARPELTVHTFGIDTAVNDAFLKRLAQQHGGGCWLRTPDDDIAGTVARLAARLQRPVLTGLEIVGNWEPGGARLTDLYAEDVLEIALRGHGPLAVAGQDAHGARQVFELTPTRCENPALPLIWARERIELLMARKETGAAVDLAKKHNLLCKGVAFIAWDEAEQVSLSTRNIYQPSARPMRLAALAASDDSTGRARALRCMSFPARPLDGDEFWGPSSPSVDRCLESTPLTRERARPALRPGRRKTQRRELLTAGLRQLESLLLARHLPSSLAGLLAAWADESPLSPGYRRREITRLIEALQRKQLASSRERRIREFIDKHFSNVPELRELLLAECRGMAASA